MPPADRTTAIVLAAGALGWTLLVLISWISGGPLGHDEAQYAIAAQDLLAGHPQRWGYLSVGMNALALPGVAAGGGEVALRIAPAVAGLGFLWAAAQVARAAAGARAAAWTVAVLAATWTVSRRAAELLSDLPAAACLLAGTAVVIEELAREPAPRWRLLLAAPLLAAAFYLRYGSILAIAALGGAALVVGWRAVLRRPAIALATIALFGVLLVPHFLVARAQTGEALGILLMSSDVLGAAYMGQSLVIYATSNPLTYYGIAAAPVLVAGLIAIRRWREPRVRLVWLAAVADIVAVGLTPVAQSRYIFFGIALLVALGVEELGTWRAMVRRADLRRALELAAGAVIAVSWLTVAVALYRQGDRRARRMEPTLAAIAAIRADAGGAPCQVIGRHTTQLQWYTGCIAIYEALPETLAQVRVYLVHEPGKEHQPPLEGRAGIARPLVQRPDIAVLRYDPP